MPRSTPHARAWQTRRRIRAAHLAWRTRRARALIARLESTDITLTNMLTVLSARALPDGARAQLTILRDRIRATLERNDPC